MFRDYQTLQSLKSEKNEKVKEESQVQTDVEQLKATVKLLQDKEYVAKLARSRFYYTKEGELVFSYPELTTDSSGSTSK